MAGNLAPNRPAFHVRPFPRATRRGVLRRPPLSERKILAWADDHFARTGTWPKYTSGRVHADDSETWNAIDHALFRATRGLAGGSSLARFLAAHRGARNNKGRPRLTPGKILRWADAHRAQSGKWPTANSGRILDTPDETWPAVDAALRAGGRGLPVDGSLARLLHEHRGVRNIHELPRLSVPKILAWADAHHARTGRWPVPHSGRIAPEPGETWSSVANALYRGTRGLRGRTTLTELLRRFRGRRNQRKPPRLTHRRILQWADAFHARRHHWPRNSDGAIPESPDDTWFMVDDAMRRGRRGLPGRDTLAQLLTRSRGAPLLKYARPELSLDQVFEWALDHFHRTGRRPSKDSGAIANAPGETWCGIDLAIRNGGRGVRRLGSLSKLLMPFLP